MSPQLFLRLAERSRRRKLQNLSALVEKKQHLVELDEKLTVNNHSSQQAMLKIKQTLWQLTQQVATTQNVYDARLQEAALMRHLLQLETEADQYQIQKTRVEADIQILRQVVRYFGIKEEKMNKAESWLRERDSK
ncbi:hypothetical protein [Enterobacter bugandensis]|uniref:hypothetical protein n=1 Tax=Enterobacter bugandensis TaxID=881260 RepID=UPI0023605AE2|nr:hypothetical protein [Enterobacter bugandensis]